MLPFLESRREEIEEQLGSKLAWNPYPQNQNKSIVLEHAADLSNPERVQEALTWLVEYTLKFRQVFSEVVQDYKESVHLP